MIRNIRLLIVLTIIAVVVTIVAISHTIPGSESTATWLCRPKQHAPLRPPRHAEIMQLLKLQQNQQARLLIEQSRPQAADSMEYYQYETLLGRYFFHTMQADSLRLSTDRLHQFLQRQTGRDDERYLQLAMCEQTQRAVYDVKMRAQMDSAIIHYNEAMRLSDKLPAYTDERLVLLTNLADAYKQKGCYDRCVHYFQKAFDLSDSLGTDTATNIVASIGIASAYTSMANFEQSEVWWQKADSLMPAMSRNQLFQYLNNRGNDFFLQKKYEESLRLFLAVDSLTKDNDDMMWERQFGHVNLSHIYIKLGRRQEAQALLDDTRQFFERQQQPLVLFYLDTQRMELALLDGDTTEALRLQQQNGIPQWVIPEQLLLRQEVLEQLYRQTGDWKQLAQVISSLQQLRDSLMGDKTRMQVSVLIMRHNHERTMLDKQKQLEEKELSFRWAIALLVAAAVVIVLLLFINFLYKKQQRMSELSMRNRIAALRMETVRNRITPHFMSNALTTEMLAQMDGREINLDPLVSLLQRGIDMTGTEQTTLHDELEFVSFYCSVERRILDSDLEFRTDIMPGVDLNQVVLPSMFVQILVENAIKHGLRSKPRREEWRPTVTVRATRHDNGTRVEVEDNGVGLPEAQRINYHTGLKVVQQTIQLLNEQNLRQMTFSLENYSQTDSDLSGCRATIYLPDDYQYTLATKK